MRLPVPRQQFADPVGWMVKPLVTALKIWLEKTLVQLASGSSIAQAMRYGLNHWDGLARFLDDGCIEIGSDTVEPAFARLLCF